MIYLVINKHISCNTSDPIKKVWKQLCESEFKSLTAYINERIDIFLTNLVNKSRLQCIYFFKFIKQIMTMNCSNTSMKWGFLVNKECFIEIGLEEKSLAAQRLLYIANGCWHLKISPKNDVLCGILNALFCRYEMLQEKCGKA